MQRLSWDIVPHHWSKSWDHVWTYLCSSVGVRVRFFETLCYCIHGLSSSSVFESELIYEYFCWSRSEVRDVQLEHHVLWRRSNPSPNTSVFGYIAARNVLPICEAWSLPRCVRTPPHLSTCVFERVGFRMVICVWVIQCSGVENSRTHCFYATP